MAKHSRIWRLPEPDPILQEVFAAGLGISRVVAQILINRGVTTLEEAWAFLAGESGFLHDPFLLRDMAKAVERIQLAISREEKIRVFGDYDADGITSTVIMLRVLKSLGAEADYYIPERLTEGYGMNPAAVQQAAEDGVNLIITVDSGISSGDEVELAGNLGMDVIVTDHHEPPEQIPRALAVINPKQRDCPYPFKDLAGAGVAFKLGQALLKENENGFPVELGELVCLGTVADIVPLKGENRVLVKKGLNSLAGTASVGLRALLDLSGISRGEIDSRQVAFQMVPRINAAGRLGDPAAAVKLLLSEDGAEASALAAELGALNEERQAIETAIYREALRMIEAGGADPDRDKVIVLAGEGWHLGVIGIVAARLVRDFYRPVVLLSISGNTARGSARSIPAFNIFEAFKRNEQYLDKYGGHQQAAGLTLAADNLAPLRAGLNRYADEVLDEEELRPEVFIDSEVALAALDEDLYRQLRLLAPHGQGNPGPLLACRQAAVTDFRPVGANGAHLKMRVRDSRVVFEAIGFDLGGYHPILAQNHGFDLVFALEKNEWNGRTALQLKIKDFKPSARADNPLGDSGPAEPDIAGSEAGFIAGNEAGFIAGLFQNAAAYLADDYHRDTAGEGKPDEERQRLAGLGRELTELRRDSAELRRALSEVRRALSALPDHELRDRIRAALLGDNHYREKQLAAIDQLLLGRNTLAVFGTGRGKSVVFQTVAAYKAIRGRELTVILYPLRALVNDRLGHLSSRLAGLGLRVCRGTGSLPAGERVILWSALAAGEIDLLLATPEFVTHHLEKLRALPKKIGLLVVDESHYPGMSSLAHRPACRQLGEIVRSLGRSLGSPLVFAATATADEDTTREIIETLKIETIVIDPQVRTNLALVDKRDWPEKNGYLKQVAGSGARTIVYVNSRLQAVELAVMLREALPGMAGQIVFYHAGLTGEQRNTIEQMFRSGQITTVVSTSAFGEGVTIPGVKEVVVFHLSSNFTEFNRQFGRCGQDGEPVRIHLLGGRRDAAVNRFLLDSNAPDRDVLAKLYVVLRESAGKVHPVTLSNDELAKMLRNSGVRAAKPNLVSAGLGILEELELIQREITGRQRQIFMKRAAAGKIDLERSLRFVEGRKEKEAFEDFQAHFFQAPAADLLNLISSPVYPRDLAGQIPYHRKGNHVII